MRMPSTPIGPLPRWTSLLSLLLLSAALLTGCADEGMSPSAPASPQPPAGPPVFLPDTPGGGAIPTGDLSASSEVLPTEGAEIRVGAFTLQIEPKTLAFPTTVTLTVVDPESLLLRVDPATARLSKEVRLTASGLDLTDGATLKTLRFFRREGTAWVALPTTRVGTDLIATSGSFGEFMVAAATTSGEALQPIRWLEGPGYTTALIYPALGGQVAWGRYRVTLPPGAVSAPTYVTVRDAANGYIMCELEPHGIRFRAPVELEMDLGGTAYEPYTDWTIWWLDDSKDAWVDQGGTFEGGKIRTQLTHFSKYGGGRAGW